MVYMPETLPLSQTTLVLCSVFLAYKLHAESQHTHHYSTYLHLLMIYQKTAVFLLSAVPRHGALRANGAETNNTKIFTRVIGAPTAAEPPKATGRGGVAI